MRQKSSDIYASSENGTAGTSHTNANKRATQPKSRYSSMANGLYTETMQFRHISCNEIRSINYI